MDNSCSARVKRAWSRVEKGWRLESVNKLILEIGSCGRRFFYNRDFGYAWMSRDIFGKIWFTDDYSGRYIYTHYSGRWKHFTHGSTLRSLVEQFRNYIQTGNKINPNYFGIYPTWYSNGDPWGYGIENMRAIREKAIELGICYNSNESSISDEKGC